MKYRIVVEVTPAYKDHSEVVRCYPEFQGWAGFWHRFPNYTFGVLSDGSVRFHNIEEAKKFLDTEIYADQKPIRTVVPYPEKA